MDGTKVWQEKFPNKMDPDSGKDLEMNEVDALNLNSIENFSKEKIESMSLIDKIKQTVPKRNKLQIEENLNSKTLDDLKKANQFDWKSAKISLGGIDLSKVPTQELKLILEETLSFANCPVGKVYSIEKKICISVPDSFQKDGMLDFNLNLGQLTVNPKSIDEKNSMKNNFGLHIQKNENLIKQDISSSKGNFQHEISTEKREDLENAGILKDTDALNQKVNSEKSLKFKSETEKAKIQSKDLNFIEKERDNDLTKSSLTQTTTLKDNALKSEKSLLQAFKINNKEGFKTELGLSSGVIQQPLSENKSSRAKPCRPSKEDIRLVIEALKKRFKGENINKNSQIGTGINFNTITSEFSKVQNSITDNSNNFQSFSSKPKYSEKGSYDRFDITKVFEKLKDKVDANLKNASKSLESKKMEVNNVFENFNKKTNNNFKKTAHEFENQAQSSSKSSSGSIERMEQNKNSKSTSFQSKVDSRITNSDGSLKMITKFHPEIKMASAINKTMKLTPVAVSGSKESTEQMMSKLLKISQTGKNNNIGLILEQFPELKGKIKLIQERTSQEKEPSDSKLNIEDKKEIPLMKQVLNKVKLNPEVKFLNDKIPSKLIIRATLPNGQIVKVGEKNLTDSSLLSSNESLTLDKLGIDFQNMNMSKSVKESLKNMNFKVEKSSKSPLEMEIITKKIKPAKFKHNMPLKASKRSRSYDENTTLNPETATKKLETTMSKLLTTLLQESSTIKTDLTSPKLISNLFKPVKEFKNLIDRKKKEVHKMFSLSDQDHKRSVEIPATNKEDIDKILEMGAPLMEFKSVLGKTLDAQGFLGKLMDEHESTKLPRTTSASLKTTAEKESSALSFKDSTTLIPSTGTPSKSTTQVTSTSNLTLLPLKVING